MLNILTSIISIIITILLVVGIHELGHFLVARWAGIKVIRFSIGFGKKLCGWHDKKGTEYIIAAIPLGGYVKMLGDDDEIVSPDQQHLAYNRQPVYKKMAVAAAGPFFNILFAFVIYWALFVTGFVSIAPVIGTIKPHSIAAQAGLQPQQEIIKIDDQLTHNWITIIVEMLSRAGDKDSMTIQVKPLHENNISEHVLPLNTWHMDDLKPDPLDSLGITPYEPVIPAIIGKISADSPASHSDLKIGDTILAIQGIPVQDWLDAMTKISLHPEQTVSFTVKRGKDTRVIPVTLGYKRDILFEKHGFLGVTPDFTWPPELLRHNKYGPIQALPHAWQDVMIFTKMNFLVIGKMLTGKISLESLGGPITIFQSAGAALNNGVLSFFAFLAFLSISIGIINIIPIPGLDGGHILFQIIEALTQKPLSHRLQMLLYRLGFIFLILLMFQAIVNDILRL
jgi:regulator of sigma E protease